MIRLIKRGRVYHLDYFIPGRGRIRRSLRTGDRRKAERFKARIQTEFDQGNFGIVDLQPIRFADFCGKYLAWARDRKRPNTYRLESGIIKNHLKPFFGQWMLSQIQPEDIDKYISERRKTTITARSVNLELGLLSLMMKKAIEWKNLLRSPFTRSVRLKELDSQQRRALNQAEITRLLECAQGNARLLIAILAYTGCRLSEAMFLSWSDIDLEREQITIQPKPAYGFNTKNGKSRVVPMHPQLKAILEDCEKKEGWLFKKPNGKRITSLRRGFETACRKADLEGVSAHCLRHSFATLMIQAGTDPRTLADLLGHSSPVITLQVYSHSFDSQRKLAIGKLPSFAPEAGEVIRFPVKKEVGN